jgi:hypothetical protein
MATSVPARRLVTAAGVARLLPSYLAFGALRYLVPLPSLARWAWRSPRVAERDPGREQRIVARVTKLRRVLERARGDCLQSSLVLYRELSKAGANPTLIVGFEPSARGLAGHAWVVTDGVPVADRAESLAGLTPTLAYGRGGVTSTYGFVVDERGRSDRV